MLNLPSQVMQALLTAAPFAFSLPASPVIAANPLFTDSTPDGAGIPDTIVVSTVADTEGKVFTRLLASGKTLVGFGIQIRTRSFDVKAGYNLLDSTRRLIDAVHNKIVTVADGGNSYTIDSITTSSPVIRMGQDERRRANYSLNLILVIFGE